MDERYLSAEQIQAFAAYLRAEERSTGTIEKYLRDVRAFAVWLSEQPVTKEATAKWKEHLLQKNYAPTTINSMLAVVNCFFRFAGWEDCRVRFLKLQRRLFRDDSRELSRDDYEKLVSSAKELGRTRLALLMEAICATGVRVSEVKYLTVEAARQKRTDIALKGKIRTILLPNKLCRKLMKYAKTQKIVSGEIFLTRDGNSLSRRQIWAEMKAVCKHAGVEATKVFPHNLRHLFARTFYKVTRDVAKLADLLGHSSIETTRIYLVSTGTEHARTLARLGLIS